MLYNTSKRQKIFNCPQYEIHDDKVPRILYAFQLTVWNSSSLDVWDHSPTAEQFRDIHNSDILSSVLDDIRVRAAKLKFPSELN